MYVYDTDTEHARIYSTTIAHPNRTLPNASCVVWLTFTRLSATHQRYTFCLSTRDEHISIQI